MNDRDSLSQLLKTWRHQPAEDRDFNRSVWGRIQSSQKPVLGFLPRSMAMAACWAAVLAAFAGGGAAYAYENLTRDERMAAAYARSIDPLQMTALDRAGHLH